MKSAAEDITLDDLPPRRKKHEEKPKRPPPKVYTPEELRDLVARAREVSQKLHDETEKLNEAICRLEDAFLEKLGDDVRGRVEIERGEHKGRPWVRFLIFKRGEFFIESNKGTRHFTETHILSTSRDTRLLATYKFKELWVACGGTPGV